MICLNEGNGSKQIQLYYNEKRKNNILIDFIVLTIIFIIPIFYMIYLSRFEAGIMLAWGNEGKQITKQMALDAIDMGYWLILQFIIRWMLVIISYVFYKLKKNKLLIFTLIISVIFIIGTLNFNNFLSNFNLNILCLIFSIAVIILEFIILKKGKDLE